MFEEAFKNKVQLLWLGLLYHKINNILYFFVNSVEKALNNEKTDQIIKEIIKEYLF